MTKIVLLKCEYKIHSSLDSRQILLLLSSWPKTFFGVRNRLACLLAVDACLRVGELIKIKMPDISIKDRLIRVQGKSRWERYVPITPSTAKSIHLWNLKHRRDVPGERLICYRNGDPLTDYQFTRILHRQSQKLGFHFSPHTLRRTGASGLHQNGASFETVRRMLGHRDPRTTLRYINQSPESLREHNDKFSIINDIKEVLV